MTSEKKPVSLNITAKIEVVVTDLPEATTTSKLFLAHLVVDTKSGWASTSMNKQTAFASSRSTVPTCPQHAVEEGVRD